MNNPENIRYFDLGYIGHQAAKMQILFNNYSKEPNQYGFYVKFIDFYNLECNQGVSVETNAFENEEHFNQVLMSKLLMSYLEK